MKSSLIAFSVLLLLASLACATDVNANFQGKAMDKNFNTSMRLTSVFNMSVVTLNGSTLGVQSGGTVCGGDTITVNATIGATWGISGIAIASLYPACSGLSGEYCPAMINAGTASGNKPIAWLAPATYDTEATFASTNGFTQDPSHRTALGGVFYNEPVTYNNGSVETPSYHSGKEGGANVFCKGTLEVRDGTTVRGNSSMPSPGTIQFTINASNTTTHTITTDLSGVSCFAALEKHPIDLTNNFYRIYYFGRNLPAIPASSATSTVTINVIANGGTCTMHTSAISVSRSAAANGTTMVRTTVHNDADAIHVLGVASSDPQFTAIQFPVNLGSVLGFGSLSPTSNGFNETINPGSDKDLYVLITTSATSGGTVLTFNAETISAVCGSSSRCNVSVDLDSSNPVTCNIVPPSLKLANNVTNGQVTSAEIGQFNVACQDLAGATVGCVGSNWAASPAITPIFMAADNTHAQLYSTAIPPVSGTVTYTSAGAPIPIAICNASLDIVKPSDIINGGNTTISCNFLPPAANMTLNEAKYFALNCALNGTVPVTPTSASYDHINGLGGSTGNESVNGATYTAPGADSSGDLQGLATYNVRPNVIGAVALAPITVSNTGTPVNCSIQPPSASVGLQEAGIFTVTCSDSAGNAVACSGSNWAWSGISGGFIAAETDNTHAWAYPTSPVGSVGLLTYTTGLAMCNSTVTVVPANASCAFSPASANPKVNSTQYFAMQAFDLTSGTPVPATPTSAIYDLINGLGGSHSNDSVTGTLYQAPSDNTSGQLQGAAVLTPGIPVCLAGITVGNGGVPPVGPNGRSDFCTIFPSSSNFYPGAIVRVSIWCGSKANQSCSGVIWSGTGTQSVDATDMGTYIIVTAQNGTQGTIHAYVNKDSKQSCDFTFTSGVTDCADLS